MTRCCRVVFGRREDVAKRTVELYATEIRLRDRRLSQPRMTDQTDQVLVSCLAALRVYHGRTSSRRAMGVLLAAEI